LILERNVFKGEGRIHLAQDGNFVDVL